MQSALVRGAAVSFLVAAGGAVLFGGVGDVRGTVFVLPLVVLFALGAVAFKRGAPVTEGAWLRGDRSAVPIGPPASPVERISAAPHRAARALARAEAKAWFTSPWFAVGIGFCVLQTVLFGWVWASDDVSSWPLFVILYPVMAFPLTGMAVVGAHFATTRSRRDRSQEIFAACPTDEITRTAAHVLSGWVPAAALATFFAVLTLVVPIHDTHPYGFRPRLIGDVLAAIVLGWCGVTFGVALARWAPFPLVPVISLFAVLVATLNVGNLGEPHWSNLRQLSPWPRYPDHDLLFTDRHVWSHLAWLVALGALMAVIAFLHARRDRSMLIVSSVVLGCVAAAGATTARPISPAGAARLASLVTEPAAHQTCRVAGRVSVCVYRGYEPYADQVLGHVRPVDAAVAAVAGDAVSGVTLRQRFDGRLAVLGPEVIAAMRGRAVGRADLALGYETGARSMHRARLLVAAHAVGLPTGPVARRPYVAAGQSRGVVALWLAAQGLPADEQAELASYQVDPYTHDDNHELTAFDLGSAWPPTCDGDAPAVVWSDADLIAARRLLGRPAMEVVRVLRAQWSHLVDAGTTTNELLTVLGLGSVAAPEPIEVKPFAC